MKLIDANVEESWLSCYFVDCYRVGAEVRKKVLGGQNTLKSLTTLTAPRSPTPMTQPPTTPTPSPSVFLSIAIFLISIVSSVLSIQVLSKGFVQESLGDGREEVRTSARVVYLILR